MALFRKSKILVPTIILVTAVSCSAPKDSSKIPTQCMPEIPERVSLTGGNAWVGSDEAYAEEAPRRAVTIAPFRIDAAEVTNAQFRKFVEETGYVTDAERPQAGFNVPGGAVFTPPSAASPSWWQFVEGANWKHPEGPDSSISERDMDPVVQVSFNDAKAYANWAGGRLPSEAEWEYAAAAGSDTHFVWGTERAPNGKEQANTWQGAFPIQNTLDDGYRLRAPVGCYKPNAFGLYDMVGNVWEWTGSAWGEENDAAGYVIKGGSFLCAENYCRRYRASARQPQEAGLPTNHIGFRVVYD